MTDKQNKMTFGRWLTLTLQASVLSTALNMGLAYIARTLFKTPKTFAPFTVAPLSSGGVGGAVGAATVWALLSRINGKPPVRIFQVISVLTLLASYYLPMRLLRTKSPRFAGANRQVVATLMVMHSVVAFVSVSLLTRSAKSGQ